MPFEKLIKPGARPIKRSARHVPQSPARALYVETWIIGLQNLNGVFVLQIVHVRTESNISQLSRLAKDCEINL